MLRRRRWAAAAIVQAILGLALLLVVLTWALATVPMPMQWRVLGVAAGAFLFTAGVLAAIAFGDALASLLTLTRGIRGSLAWNNSTLKQQAKHVRGLENEQKACGRRLDALERSLGSQSAIQASLVEDLAAFRASTAARELEMVDWLEDLQRLSSARECGCGQERALTHHSANGPVIGERDTPSANQQTPLHARWISRRSSQPQVNERNGR